LEMVKGCMKKWKKVAIGSTEGEKQKEKKRSLVLRAQKRVRGNCLKKKAEESRRGKARSNRG